MGAANRSAVITLVERTSRFLILQRVPYDHNADRIAVLSHGRLAALGTIGELIARAGAASFEDAFVRLAGGEG